MVVLPDEVEMDGVRGEDWAAGDRRGAMSAQTRARIGIDGGESLDYQQATIDRMHDRAWSLGARSDSRLSANLLIPSWRETLRHGCGASGTGIRWPLSVAVQLCVLYLCSAPYRSCCKYGGQEELSAWICRIPARRTGQASTSSSRVSPAIDFLVKLCGVVKL